MENNFHHIVSLFKRAIAGEIEDGEKAEWDSLREQEAFKTLLSSLSDDRAVEERLNEYRRFPSAQAFQEFKKQVGSPSRKRLYLFASSVAVAAMVIVFLMVSMNKMQSGDTPLVSSSIEIQPGTQRAQIRLADGSVVDVAGDSMKIEHGNGVHIAYNNGAISYDVEKEVTKLEYNELVVPLAGECYITLSDGTKVWVNSDSKLKYPIKFVGAERTVFLDGEAYFEVTKDTKPFVVHTSLGNVNVLGTSFGVKAYRDEAEVLTTLVAGRVRFDGRNSVEIAPGEQSVASADGSVLKRAVDIDEYVGWKSGVYVFREATLESIMNNLARWYGIHVFFQNSKLKEIKFTGSLKRYDNINTFMVLLKRTGDVDYKIKGTTIMLFE